MTTTELLAKWDAGETVFTIEMGGFGPGYEMAIQGLMFEILREFKDVEWPDGEWSDEFRQSINDGADAVVDRCDKLSWGGFSGAQVGGAKNLAFQIATRGHDEVMADRRVCDRHIQVCRKDLRQEVTS